MGGFHAVVVDGDLEPDVLIRSVYGLGADAALQPRGTSEFEHTAEDRTAGVGHVAGWTVLWGGFPESFGGVDEFPGLAQLSRERRLFRWAEERVSGSVVLDYFADGMHLRNFWSVEGEVTEADGPPLEGEPESGFEEADQSEVDIWSIVAVLERYIAPWDTISGAEYQMFSFGR
ncbi:MAG TPA: hypothetical protein VJT67_11765 [Longimicrobiaceae bacterium]|nr:hypothetical protein [Longimicrobiaceae bacterium]